MKKGGQIIIVATLTAAWASVAHGGAFNACTVTYAYDGTILINGERFFPVGNYFLPQGYPENEHTPEIGEAYQAFAANGGNFLVGPRYYNMSGGTDNYGVHGNPSDLYYDENKCVYHLDAADQSGVKLLTGPYIYWWWDENEYPPGPHPIGIDVSQLFGWPINISPVTQEDRFSGLPPNGGIKGWVENGASGAFMGYDNWGESAWAFWRHRFFPLGEYPRPPTTEPTAENLRVNYAGLRALEEEPGVDAYHATWHFEAGTIVRTQDLWRDYIGATDIVGCGTSAVPEPYAAYDADKGLGSWIGNGVLPNYHSAVIGDCMDVIYETAKGEKPVLCIIQNHYRAAPLPDGSLIGAEPTEGQYRFMTYDSVIHRANGILYGVQSFGCIDLETGKWLIYEDLWDPCKPTFNEIGQNGVMHEIMKGEYDNLLVEVIIKQQGIEVERSAFVGGELAPKNHFLSNQILMEGCAKKYGGHTYLIVACRVGIDQLNPATPPPYEATFRPYFSNKTTWTGTVEVVGEEAPGGGVRTIDIVNGAFTDEFDPEVVHIYKFQKPSPYVPD
jgi:hypothetical protein